MEKSNTSKIVIGFFTLILGIVLISTIADSGSLVTVKSNILNETIDISSAVYGNTTINTTINTSKILYIANYPSGWKVSDCPITNFVMRNQTGSTATVTTDYVFTTSNGTLTLKNTRVFNQSATSNDTYVDYTFCGNDYVNLAWGRTIINLVAGFFALGLLGVSVGLFYSVAKDSNLIGK